MVRRGGGIIFGTPGRPPAGDANLGHERVFRADFGGYRRTPTGDECTLLLLNGTENWRSGFQKCNHKGVAAQLIASREATGDFPVLCDLQ